MLFFIILLYIHATSTATMASSSVKTITINNFEATALDIDRNVFVEFFHPQCPHCQTMAPIFERVGQIFAADPKVIFVIIL